MKYSNFDLLKAIVLTTPEKEFKVIRKSIASDNRQKSSLSIVDSLLDGTGSDFKTLWQKTAPSTEKKSFDRSLSRLIDKICDQSQTDQVLSINFETDNKNAILLMQLRKKFNAYLKFYMRGNMHMATQMMRKLVPIAEEYEYFGFAAEILNDVMEAEAFQNKMDEYERMVEKANRYHEAQAAIYKGYIYLTTYYSKYVDFKGTHKDKYAFLIGVITYLEEENEKIFSYYLQKLLSEFRYIYQFMLGDYEKSVEYQKEILRLANSSKALNNSNVFGTAHNNIADAEMMNYQFKEAIESCRTAMTYLRVGSYNYLMSLDVLFLSQFYLGEIEEAKTTLVHAVDLSQTRSEELFQKDKRAYRLAALKFVQGEFSGCIKLLNQIQELDGDREGYNLSIRILTIICLVEQGEFKIASAKTLAMQKYLSDSMSEEVRERDMVIIELISVLKKHRWTFGNFSEYTLATILKLKTEFPFEIKTAELIIFEDWFETKIRGRHYLLRTPEKPEFHGEQPQPKIGVKASS